MKVQRILDVWYNILCFVGGYLELLKCYWTTQDHLCKEGNYVIINNSNHALCINIEGRKEKVIHVNTTHARVLVGIFISQAHQDDQFSTPFDKKIVGYIANLTTNNLAPNNVLF